MASAYRSSYASSSRAKIDWPSVLLYAVLVFWGWLSIYSAVYNEEDHNLLDMGQRHGKQLVFIGTSVLLIIAIMIIDARFWVNLSPMWYIIGLLLLVGVLVVGKKVGGARSWYGIGSFSLQPSEIAKFTTLLMMAFYMSLPKIDVRRWSNRIIAAGIFVVPGLLIGLQPDLGSTIIYLSLVLVLYREGMPGYYLGAGLGIIGLSILGLIMPLKSALIVLGVLSFVVFLILPKKRNHILLNVLSLIASSGIVIAVGRIMEKVLAPHQQDRIRILLGLQDDPNGAGYNTLQSLIAIGSGGWTGKGYLGGTQTKLNFVPEQSTDYIFCTVGEEWGFLGSLLLMLLFGLLIGRIIYLADKQKNTFGRVYGYGVASILFTHWMINIGMTIGLVPTIGIPLPFFSYGGSSLWGFTILLFIFIKLDSERWNSLS
ncbi:MAG: rod shape-determining protein RodA [Bacteroidota bacterium]